MDQNGSIEIVSPYPPPRNISLKNYLHRSQGVQVRDYSIWVNRNKKQHLEEGRKQGFTSLSPPSRPRNRAHRGTRSGWEGSKVSARQ